MSDQTITITEVKLDDLIPFRSAKSQICHGERLYAFIDDILSNGLITPILVRPIDDGKYEIVCGHNRVKAFRTMGRETIPADIRAELTDEGALGKFYGSNLNQQSFSDWPYSQKIEAIKYIEKLIQENSQQGKRTDLVRNSEETSGGGTSVSDRQKLGGDSKKTTTRDKMARRLGIGTATFSRYKSIIKLSDDRIDDLAQMLDDKRVTLEAAYIISKFKLIEVGQLIQILKDSPNVKYDLKKLKSLCAKSKDSPDDYLTKVGLMEALVTDVK